MKSPSARKVWIEITINPLLALGSLSPSARKVWIEMFETRHKPQNSTVTFREEGVD